MKLTWACDPGAQRIRLSRVLITAVAFAAFWLAVAGVFLPRRVAGAHDHSSLPVIKAKVPEKALYAVQKYRQHWADLAIAIPLLVLLALLAFAVTGPDHLQSTPILLACISLIALVVAVYQLGAHDLQGDEALSWAFAQAPWGVFGRVVSLGEANMVFYYLLLRMWSQGGTSEAFLRLLSALFFLISVPATYLLGSRVLGRRAGLAGALLVACNGFCLRQARQVRSYTLLVLLTLLSSFLMLETLEDPSPGKRAAYIVVSTLSLYTHFFAALILVAQLVFLLLSYPARFRERLWDLAAVGILCLPLAVFVAVTRHTLFWIEPLSLRSIAHLLSDLCGNGSVLICALSLAAVAWAINRAERRAIALPLALFLIPLAISVALSLLYPVVISKYLIICVPPLALLVAAGVVSLRPKALQFVVLLVLLVASYGGVRSVYVEWAEEWRPAVRLVLAAARPGDAIFFYHPAASFAFEYYARRFGASQRPAVINGGFEAAGYFSPEVQAAPRIPPFTKRYPRIWFVRYHDAKLPGRVEESAHARALLASVYGPPREWNFAGVKVLLFGPSPRT